MDPVVLLRLAAYFDDVSRLHLIARDVDDAAVNRQVTVTDQLARCITRTCDAETVHRVIKATLEQRDKVCTGNATLTVGTIERTPELLFEQTIRPLDLLLFAQLNAVFGRTSSTGVDA